ncbi:MAG: lipoyl-dependent peroxiredoxin [Solirubrobacteraceae bacterium]|jgi:osmotically inducible protein OsmC|nr:lipoyl-dependent peroxiredoxin [Solirubrobacteraceae bacterium]
MAKNIADAKWTGGLKDGEGHMAFGGYDGGFTFRSRFEDAEGTNPEQLIGAALAGCFSMQFSAFLHNDGIESESVETQAEVTLRPVDGSPTITTIALTATVTAPGADADKVREIGEQAKQKCPVSRALAVEEISLDVTLR